MLVGFHYVVKQDNNIYGQPPHQTCFEHPINTLEQHIYYRILLFPPFRFLIINILHQVKLNI